MALEVVDAFAAPHVPDRDQTGEVARAHHRPVRLPRDAVNLGPVAVLQQ